MKVLLISHTVLSKTGNMGKTFSGYLSDFEPSEVSQFYIHSEVPTDDEVCTDYYHFTDRDAIKSLNRFKTFGTQFAASDIQKGRVSTRTDVGAIGAIYQYGRKRTGLIYLARNSLWALANWKTDKFKNWLRNVNPDVILFASGDYGFMYRIALWVSEYLDKPLVISCVDDYYLNNRNSGKISGQISQHFFMRNVKASMSRAKLVLTICERMAAEYSAMFGKICKVIYTSAENNLLNINSSASSVSYIGNLGYNRSKQIINIGRALKNLGQHIDVYSAEKRSEVLKDLNEDNGIRFHGQISADEVLRVMENSAFVIHTESFDEINMALVKYSVSTKIAESLMYGPCIIAYGPEGIASIDYLKENNAAYVITRPEDLQTGLREILTNRSLRDEIVGNARKLAAKNHNTETNGEKVRMWLDDIVNNNEKV